MTESFERNEIPKIAEIPVSQENLGPRWVMDSENGREFLDRNLFYRCGVFSHKFAARSIFPLTSGKNS
jgi:hypothetical protein